MWYLFYGKRKSPRDEKKMFVGWMLVGAISEQVAHEGVEAIESQVCFRKYEQAYARYQHLTQLAA